MSEGDDDDNVGFGHPPKAHQWKPGQSGNSQGRPRGVRNFNTDLEGLLKSRVSVTEAGRQKKVSVQKAALMRLGEKALKGDNRAIEKLLELALNLSVERAGRQAERALSGTEEAILARFLKGANMPATSSDRDSLTGEDDLGQ